MSTTPKDGGPIASSMQPDGSNGLIAIGGLSKREYFAAMAMQGLILHNNYGHVSDEDIANGAVAYADALLEFLNEEVAS